MNHLINFVLSSKLFISLSVFSLALATQYTLGLYDFKLLLLLFFGTFLSYNFQRFIFCYTVKKDLKSFWILKNKYVFQFLLLISVIIFSNLFLKLSGITQLMVLMISTISLSYPILRKTPYLKIFLIAFSWSFSTVALIYYESNFVLNSNVVLSIISRMFFIIAITIPFDIRDVEYDKKKTYTIPMLVGDNMAKKIAVFFLLLFLIIDSYLYLNNLNFGFFISTILCFLYSFYFVSKDNQKKDGLYYSFWLESCSISLLFFLILTSIFL